jgi:hypothetical protein
MSNDSRKSLATAAPALPRNVGAHGVPLAALSSQGRALRAAHAVTAFAVAAVDATIGNAVRYAAPRAENVVCRVLRAVDVRIDPAAAPVAQRAQYAAAPRPVNPADHSADDDVLSTAVEMPREREIAYIAHADRWDFAERLLCAASRGDSEVLIESMRQTEDDRLATLSEAEVTRIMRHIDRDRMAEFGLVVARWERACATAAARGARALTASLREPVSAVADTVPMRRATTTGPAATRK